MAKKADKAPEAPTPAEAQSAIDEMVAAIKAAEQRVKDRLPPEAIPAANVIEQLVNQELDRVNFAQWRETVGLELVALFTSGKSNVQHDPTELA